MSLTGIALLQGLPLVVVLVILYFAFVRPQWRLARAHTQMLSALSPGDYVVTEGGLYARVATLLDETNLVLEFSPTLQIKAKKRAISEVIAKEPADPPVAATDPGIAG